MKAVIIEDEFIVADHLASILKKYKFLPIATVDNLQDAEKTLIWEPDFFLVDIRLAQNQNGIDFGKKLASFIMVKK